MKGIFNTRILGGEMGSVVWDNGFIVGRYAAKGPENCPQDILWIDGKGQECYPAFIDIHVHDRHDEPAKEDPEHLEAACHEGGVGTIVTMGNGSTAETAFTHIDQL